MLFRFYRYNFEDKHIRFELIDIYGNFTYLFPRDKDVYEGKGYYI